MQELGQVALKGVLIDIQSLLIRISVRTMPKISWWSIYLFLMSFMRIQKPYRLTTLFLPALRRQQYKSMSQTGRYNTSESVSVLCPRRTKDDGSHPHPQYCTIAPATTLSKVTPR